MGNRYGSVIEKRMLLAAMQYLEALPTETVLAIQRYVERRTAQESEGELVNVHDPRHTSHRLDPSEESMQFVEREERA